MKSRFFPKEIVETGRRDRSNCSENSTGATNFKKLSIRNVLSQYSAYSASDCYITRALQYRALDGYVPKLLYSTGQVTFKSLNLKSLSLSVAGLEQAAGLRFLTELYHEVGSTSSPTEAHASRRDQFMSS